MLHSQKLTSHPALTTHEHINRICQPIFEFLGINYFALHRTYSDGTSIRLSNYPKWTERYITANYFSVVKIDHYNLSQRSYEYHLWSQYNHYDPKGFEVVLESYRDFGISSGFSIVKNFEDHVDTYNFAVMNNTNISFYEGIYLTMIEPIEKFIGYFLEQAADIIKESEKFRFKTKIIKPTEILIPQFNLETQENLKKETFNFSLAPSLSERQRECGSLLLQGLTVKEIARKLNISPRTVEEHINVLKSKLDAPNRTNLIIKLGGLIS